MDKRSDPARQADALAQAVNHLARGVWQRAHEIAQQEKFPLAAWFHGIVHTLEGNLENARYWYRQAGRSFAGKEAVEDEIATARRGLRECPARGKT